MISIERVLKDLRANLVKLYDGRLVKMILYGSHARGEGRPDSDIDVIVVLRGAVDPCAEMDRTEEAVSDISLAHNTVVCCLFKSEEEAESEKSPLMINVRREGMIF